jgi:hypothetical protein
MVPGWAVLAAVGAVVVVGVGAVAVARRRERLLRERCEGALSQYMPMGDHDQTAIPLYRHNIELR